MGNWYHLSYRVPAALLADKQPSNWCGQVPSLDEDIPHSCRPYCMRINIKMKYAGICQRIHRKRRAIYNFFTVIPKGMIWCQYSVVGASLGSKGKSPRTMEKGKERKGEETVLRFGRYTFFIHGRLFFSSSLPKLRYHRSAQF
jgi:hypothetical protein